MERARDAETIKVRLRETAEQLGFTSIFGGWVPSAGAQLGAEAVAEKVLISTMPDDWQSRYLERSYLFRDPIVHYLQTSHNPFTWEDAYRQGPNAKDVKLIRGEASEFGLREGFVVPIELLGGLQLAFSFGASTLDVEPESLGMLAFATNIAAGHLLDHAAPRSARGPAASPAITARERDCLAWASEGKTDWEIAAILGISVPTVRKHLASAREKLQAVNKYHAVALGIRTGLLR